MPSANSFMRRNIKFVIRGSRHDYSNKEYPEDLNNAMRRTWFAYGDLGYDGVNGNRAKIVMDNLGIVIKFFEARFGVKIDE